MDKRIPVSLNILVLLLLLSYCCFGQNEKKLVRDGNKLYKNNKFSDAEINYRKALEKDKDSYESKFNLGDALYKQGKYPEALEQFQSLTDKNISEENRAKLQHNIANSLLKTKKYEESIEAFKKSLKLNAKDGDTKYNLEYAKEMLKKQQEQQKNDKNKDKKDDKDKKKDDKKEEDKNKKDDKKDEKKDNKKNDKKEEKKNEGDKGEKDDQQKNQPKDKSKISKEDAQRMLDALNNKEKQAQKKLGKKEGARVAVEKDW
jgi:Ca-activated chloride channel family protein